MHEIVIVESKCVWVWGACWEGAVNWNPFFKILEVWEGSSLMEEKLSEFCSIFGENRIVVCLLEPVKTVSMPFG